MPEAKQISADTLDLAKLVLSLERAELYRLSLFKSPSTRDKARDMFTRIGTYIRCATRELTDKLQPEQLRVVREEILNADLSLQLENLQNMFIALPKGKRDELERLIEGHYNVYKLNK